AGRDAACGRLLEELLPLISEATGEPVPSPGSACLRHGIAETREAVLPAAHGDSARTLDLSATPIRDADGAVTGAAVLARDVTQARRIARQLAHQATHDPLTGLVNRTEFERRLTHVLAGTAGARAQHALCFLDLDGFKRVNDASGHQAGDELLRQLSELMRERMRSRDTLARLGGDEFGVLLEHCRRPQAERVAEQLRKAVAGHRFMVDGRTYTVGASIGVVPIRSGMRPAEAVRLADAACYAAKRSGGDRVFVSDAPLSGPATRHEAKWSQRVLRAIEARRLRLDAQPVIPLGRAAGAPQFELLLRLEETPGAPVMPPSFLPTARRNGLMPILDDWVIREAMRRLGDWSDAHPSWPCPRVAINLSEETVAAGNAPAVIEGALASHGVPPDALCFEVSEATIMAHPAAGMDLFRRLRSLGCRSTIEHCGTGIAAFTHLRRLRPDFLKMAGHIVREVDRDPVQCALATALNQVGHVLGMGTIGFQVERPAALAELRRLGVDYAQGFGIGRPEPLSQALARAG
ncbi:MAG TPA: EAL domain-containing protein, partial [Gemmatimonadales bacterium]|nr:EAL domain-containing protein [Gemmatimonadales bacterium]